VNTERVSYEQLMGISACLALALASHLASLPLWVTPLAMGCGIVRLVMARNGRGAPPRWVVLTLAALAIPLLLLRFHTFNGLSAGTALLAVMGGLKLLETKTKRDVYFITLIIYFVSLSALLEGDSFWLLAYLIGVCWLTTATLLRLTSRGPPPDWRSSMRYGGRILIQALPLMFVFWLLFPRFAAPLWRIPNDSRSAESGLSDTMSPGDITQLALSDEIAFRVHFEAAAPPPPERYWRGPVLHMFDGHSWSRGYAPALSPPPLQPQGAAYHYTVMMEPHQHRWIFTLDWPVHWDLAGAGVTSDNTLMRDDPLSRAIDVAAISYTRVQSAEVLSTEERRRDTQAPRNRNPRTLQLSRQLRSEHPDDMDYVHAVLSMFTEQPFYYTLTPPKLADNSVDEFLFDTKRGFCGHYASAFAALLRDAGIPTRVVTGYQGGTFNPYGDYWILRQSDAHAWDEVFVDGRGWVRVDPTAAIAPQRVERGLAYAASADEPLASRWQQNSPWLAGVRLRLDVLREIWRERILDFDQESQQNLLKMLRIPEPDGQKLVMLLAAAMTLVLGWLTWQVRRELDPRSGDAATRAYARLCARLAAAGLPRMPYEGSEAFATRVSGQRPDLAMAVTALCRQYSALRYAAPSSSMTLGQFEAAVRTFRPRHSARSAVTLSP
jgi:protein-glutamine gamma-glutamyltransferase